MRDIVLIQIKSEAIIKMKIMNTFKIQRIKLKTSTVKFWSSDHISGGKSTLGIFRGGASLYLTLSLRLSVTVSYYPPLVYAFVNFFQKYRFLFPVLIIQRVPLH